MWRAQGKRLFWPVRRVQVPKGDDALFPREGSISLLNSLRDALIHGKKPETSGDDNIWTLAMVEAGMRSAAEGRLVHIEEVLNYSAGSQEPQDEVA
jgi:hypothetical protein